MKDYMSFNGLNLGFLLLNLRDLNLGDLLLTNFINVTNPISKSSSTFKRMITRNVYNIFIINMI